MKGGTSRHEADAEADGEQAGMPPHRTDGSATSGSEMLDQFARHGGILEEPNHGWTLRRLQRAGRISPQQFPRGEAEVLSLGPCRGRRSNWDGRISWVAGPMAGCPATALMSCGGQDRISSAVRGKGLPGAPELASMVAPLVLGDTVCFAGRKGKLTVTTAEGKPLWSTKLPGQCHSAPAAADGLLIVGCDDGNLYAFRSA